MVTTACNAATMPVIGPYLDELQKWLSAEGFGGSVLMMLSNGGVVSADDAARFPIRLVECGPAAGALAGTWFAAPHGRGPPAVLRHGRHHGQGLPDRARRARPHEHVRGRPHVPLQEGLGVPGVGAVGRPRRDRRRRRQPGPRRPVRPAQGRPRVGRRRPRSGVATAAAAPSRRSPTPTSCSACSTRPASSAATCRSTHRWRRTRVGGVADELGARPRRHRVGHPRGRQPEHGRRRADARRRAGRRPARRPAARLRRRRAGARLRRGRAARVVAGGVPGQRQRAVGVRHARVAGADRPRPLDGARPRQRSTPAERDAVLDELRAEGRRVLLAAGVPADAVRFRYGADVRYAGQGNEVTVWVGDEANIDVWPATPTSSAPRSRPSTGGSTGSRSPTSASRSSRGGSRPCRPAAAFEPTPVARRHRRHARRRTDRSCSSAAQPAQRRRRLQARSTLGAGDDVRRPGDRRGARDDGRHPPRLARRGRHRRQPRSPLATAGSAT